MSKPKNKCIQCGKTIEGDIRCNSCKTRNKHASPNQMRRTFKGKKI
ncbi:MAG: hypothetical protein AABX11_02695 [Nanoarchaeota archaeon]